MEAGKRRTRLVIERRTTTSHPEFGTPVESWGVHKRVRAEVQDLLPSRGERIAEGINVAARPCRIRIRYRDDVTSDMRVKIGSRTLRIVTMPASIGMGRWLEFVAEEVTTSGQEP